MWPYFDLAAEYDLLILVHADAGPPPESRVDGCCASFNGDLGRPALYEPIPGSIEVIESAPFLSETQKRSILHDNAARLLELE